MKNRLLSDELECNKFFTYISDEFDTTKDKQLAQFLQWCLNNGFFENITDDDIDFFYEYGSLPLLKNHHITIGIEYWKGYGDYALVGIDPSKCFNKTKQCSIVAKLPLTSKREEKQFYKLLDIILDYKNPFTKEWFKSASSSWFGEYRNFNYR